MSNVNTDLYCGSDKLNVYHLVTQFSNGLRLGARILHTTRMMESQGFNCAILNVGVRIRLDLNVPNPTATKFDNALSEMVWSLPIHKHTSKHISTSIDLGTITVRDVKGVDHYTNQVANNGFMVLVIKNLLLAFGLEEPIDLEAPQVKYFLTTLKDFILKELESLRFSMIALQDTHTATDTSHKEPDVKEGIEVEQGEQGTPNWSQLINGQLDAPDIQGT